MKAFIIYKHLLDLDGNNFVIGGIETYLENLAQVIIKFGISPVIVQCANKDFSKKVEEIQFYGFKHSINKEFHKFLYKKIKNKIKEEDILIWGTDTFSIKTDHKRSISIQHGIDFDYYPLEDKLRYKAYKLGLGHFFKFLQRRRARNVFTKAKYHVCVDYNFWNWYRTFCLPDEEDKIFVIPNFSHLHKKSPFPKPANKPIEVLFARRFVRRRGIEIFMDVVQHFKNTDSLHFTFAGDGPYLDQVEKIAENNKNVKITKYKQAESLAFHSSFDIAIIPTIGSEGTSFSLLEAMSTGNVCICTCVGGMTNIILDNFNGYFVRPNSSKDIIDKISFLINNPEKMEYLSQNAQKTIESSFSFDIWEQRWINVLKEITEE
jgi:glycosyltransferase, family 1